jgi:ribosome-binding factor A
MESKRQLQVAELIRRNFGHILLSEGSYIYGDALVTLTGVKVSPDLAQAKIYLSVYNHTNKQEVLMMIEEHHHQLKQALAKRIRKHVRRVPEPMFFLDDTLDEAMRLENLFKELREDDQMGQEGGDQ